MEYDIAESTSISLLKFSVKKMISEGWIPSGGIAITSDEDTECFYQAMIKTNQVEISKSSTILDHHSLLNYTSNTNYDLQISHMYHNSPDGGLIPVIKETRRLYGCDLKEAKDFVEANFRKKP